MLTVKECAGALGLTEATIRAWIYQRRLAYVKLGRSVRIPRDQIDKLLLENMIPAARQIRG